MKKEEGITLIALIITSIVIMILAGVTIKAAMGDNGIIKKAQNAQASVNDGEELEKVKIAVADAKINSYGKNNGILTQPILEDALKQKFEKSTGSTEEEAFIITIIRKGGKQKKYSVLENGKIISDQVNSDIILKTIKNPKTDLDTAFSEKEKEQIKNGEKKLELIIDVENIEYGTFKNWELYNYIDSISFSSNVKEIGNHAFSNCSSIKRINFNEGLEKIDENAFVNDYLLEGELYIPSTVKSFAEGAFRNGNNISKITVDSKNSYYESKTNCLIEKSTQTVIYGCNDFKLPEGTKKIGDAACSSVRTSNFSLPSSLEEIGDFAFHGAELNLNGIVFGTNIKKIGQEAFSGEKIFENYSEIYISEKIEEIGRNAFESYYPYKFYYVHIDKTEEEIKNLKNYYNWGLLAYVYDKDNNLLPK